MKKIFDLYFELLDMSDLKTKTAFEKVIEKINSQEEKINELEQKLNEKENQLF